MEHAKIVCSSFILMDAIFYWRFMSTIDDVKNKLRGVIDPEIGISIVELDMVKEIKLEGERATLKIALTVPECPLTSKIKKDIGDILRSLGFSNYSVNFTTMNDEERRRLVEYVRSKRIRKINETRMSQERAPSPLSKLSNPSIHNIIAIMSGKGGVGKSTVCGLIANELARRGFKVGILDGDITGPSVPKLFGLSGRLSTDGNKIVPALTKTGIKVVSMNLIVERETDATIWRGPILSNVIRQFFSDVMWGELDYLLIDLPPGTTDAQLTVFQSFDVNGVVLVTTANELSRVIVSKALNMAKKLEAPVLGIIENMAYYSCPHCGHVETFGKGAGEEISREFGIPLLARLPLDPNLTRFTDSGQIEEYANLLIEEAVNELGRERIRRLTIVEADGSQV
jgi:ATP-binding protein involved in chromosome partitioning